MFKKNLSRQDIVLIAANLIPAAGALFLGWNPKQIFMVYALETVIIGIITLLKMAAVTVVRKTDTWYSEGGRSQQSGWVFMLFFLVHYGMFVALQTGLFIQVSGINRDFHNGFFDFFIHWPKYLGTDAYYMLAGFFASYSFSLYWDFIRNGQYRTVSMTLLMFQPYNRILVQQLTVILGSMFLTFGAGKIFILVFASAKIYFEVYLNYDSLLKKTVTGLQKNSGEQ